MTLSFGMNVSPTMNDIQQCLEEASDESSSSEDG